MQKQRMRIAPAPKLEWKVVAISNPDPIIFARELQTSLQELTDNGFAINGQLQRGEALVISASRMQQVDAAAMPLRRRIVDLPNAKQAGAPFEEVLYHYNERGMQKQRRFTALVDALRVLKEDLAREGVLPLNITTVSMTRFDADAFSFLLKMFAEDLPTPPG